MVTTRASGTETQLGSDPLATIAARLDAIDELREKVEALEAVTAKSNPRGKNVRYTDDSDDDGERGRF